MHFCQSVGLFRRVQQKLDDFYEKNRSFKQLHIEKTYEDCRKVAETLQGTLALSVT